MCDKGLMLISDDFAIDREMLRDIFEEEFDILEAENGLEAIKQIEAVGYPDAQSHRPGRSGISKH